MPEAANRLAEGLGLPLDETDWEIVNAAPARVGEFLDFYEQKSLPDDDAFALMALTISSLDDLINAGGEWLPHSECLQRIMDARFELHEATVHYWCQWKEDDPENLFAISPLMREIWSKHAGS